MNRILFDGDHVVVKPRGWAKIFGFRRELRLQASNVRHVAADSGIGSRSPESRLMGTSLPGRYMGTFLAEGRASYWNVRDPRQNIVLELVNEGFRKAVLTVEDPEGEERRIRSFLAEHRQ